MVKIIMILIVFIICSMAGYILGEIYRKRPLDLKECYKGIILLQNQVIYNNTALPEALMEVSLKIREPYCDYLKKVSDDLKIGIKDDIFQSFKDNYPLYSNEMYLRDEDKKIFSDFVISLGESGVYGADKVFKLTLDNLKMNINEAEELSKKNTKMYRYLGICFGAMISIILI